MAGKEKLVWGLNVALNTAAIVLAVLHLCAVQKYNKIQLYEFLKGKHCHVKIMRCSKGEYQNQKHIR